MFKLEKLSVEDGKYSAVSAGEVFELPYARLYKWDTGDKKGVINLNDIQVGWQIELSNDPSFSQKMSKSTQRMNTSKIREITSHFDNSMVFNTETSTYQLTHSGK